MKVTLKAAVVAALVMLLVGGGVAGAARLITGKNIRNSSITGADIKNRSLTPSDFRGSVRGVQGPAGPAGARGANGANGAQGPAGPQGSAGIASVTSVTSAPVSVPPGEVRGASVGCPAGSAVVGTGFNASVGNVGFVQRFGNTVSIGVVNDTGIFIDIVAQALCASGPGVSASSARSASESFEREVAALRAAHR